MRPATPSFLVTLLACGDGTNPAGHAPAASTAAPDAPAALPDPFVRVAPEDLVPVFDRAQLECDGAGWLLTAELVGRVDAVRAVIVRTEGRSGAWDLDLRAQPMAEGAVWQPFRRLLEDPTAECDRYESAVVFEARDAAGKTVDCVAFGAGAEELLAGELDDRLASVARGDWTGCRVR
jgi:hypothetical protein